MKHLPIWLSNFLARLDAKFTREPYLTNRDGRLVPIDGWDGYEACMRPGCGHYHCEHSFGESWTTVYVKDPEQQNRVGEQTEWPVGCMNGGCKCDKFWTVDDLVSWSQRLSNARVNSAWDLSQVPGVLDVESEVLTTVRMTSYTESHEATAREVIYTEEEILMNKYPFALFDFHISWEKPKD
jgi:hypothetical protein